MAPLAFSYNTSLHRTTKSTPYALTFGQEARIPSFPNPDIQRHYGESQPSEWYQRLIQARHLAAQNSMTVSQQSKDNHDKHAVQHTYKVNDLIWLHEENFLGRNRKISPKWTGPYKIVKVFNFGVVDIEYKGKIYRLNVGRIKPFVNLPNERKQQPITQPPQQQQPQQEQQQQQQEAPQLEEHACAHTHTQQEEESNATPAKRGRGRPRKQATETQGNVQHETEAQTEPILREDIQGGAAALPERRVTRQMVQEGTGVLTEGQIETVEKANILQWRPAVSQGPAYSCDQYGLPIPPQGKKIPQWILDRQRTLKQLTPSLRNKLLTGDPGFQFDPIAYEPLLVRYQHQPIQQEQQPQQQQPPQPQQLQPEEREDTPPRQASPERDNTPPRQASPVPENEQEEEVKQQPPQQQQQKPFTPPAATRSGKTFRTPPPPTQGVARWTTLRSPSAGSSQSGSSTSFGAKAKAVVKAFTTVPPPPGTRAPASTSSRGRDRFPTLKAQEEQERQRQLQLRRQRLLEARPPTEEEDFERRQSVSSNKTRRSP